MNNIILVHKSKMSADELNATPIQHLLEIADDVNIKIIPLANFVKLFNLGYAIEFQDYYIRTF
jgi:hypothetical protein